MSFRLWSTFKLFELDQKRIFAQSAVTWSLTVRNFVFDPVWKWIKSEISNSFKSHDYYFRIRGNMKCPKKHMKDDFVMWWHLNFILKCHEFEDFRFRFLFCFKIDHVLIFWNTPLPYFRNFWNAPFFPFHKNSTWSILKQKGNRKWKSSFLGHFKIKCICHHMTKSSFSCFLRHFILLPVEVDQKRHDMHMHHVTHLLHILNWI